jgi:hypothetical protein
MRGIGLPSGFAGRDLLSSSQPETLCQQTASEQVLDFLPERPYFRRTGRDSRATCTNLAIAGLSVHRDFCFAVQLHQLQKVPLLLYY